MSIKKSKYLLFILLGVLSLQFQCNKGSITCKQTVYSFELGIKAYPDRDSINVGDTIWLEVNEPTILKDDVTSSMINYAGAANLGTAISFARLIAVNSTNDQVATQFKFAIADGTEIQRSDTIKYREYKFIESNGSYKFKLGIVPKEKGVFKMFISNAANVYRNSDKCTKAAFAINFKETNQHLYFNQVSFPGAVLPPGEGVYFFKVI